MNQWDSETTLEGQPVSSSVAPHDCIQNEAHSNHSISGGEEKATLSNINGFPVPQSKSITPNLSNLDRDCVAKKSNIDRIRMCDQQGNIKLSESLTSSTELPVSEDGKSSEANDSTIKTNSSNESQKNEYMVESSSLSSELSSPNILQFKQDQSLSHDLLLRDNSSKEVIITDKQVTSTQDSSSSSSEPSSFSKALPLSSISSELVSVEAAQYGLVSKNPVKDQSTDSMSLLNTNQNEQTVAQPPTAQSTSSATFEVMDICDTVDTHQSHPCSSSVLTDAQIQDSSATSHATAPSTPSSSSSSTSTSAFQPSPSISNKVEAVAQATIAGPEIAVLDNVKTELSEHVESEAESEKSDSHEGQQVSPSTDPRDKESSCKILTKYIFIDKPSKGRTGKKRLGLLYKQAFRHFQRSKVTSRSPMGKYLTVKTVIEKKPSIKSSEQKAVKETQKTRKRKRSDSVVDKKKKRIVKNGRKDGTSSLVTIVKKKSRKKSTVKGERTTQRRKSQRTAGKKISSYLAVGEEFETEVPPVEKRVKSKKRKALTLSKKVDIIENLESPSVSFSSVAKSFNVGKSSLARIMKQKDKILAEKEAKDKKMTKRLKKSVEKSKGSKSKVLEVKEEMWDHEADESEVGIKVDIAEDDNDFSLDPSAAFPIDISESGRSRKELTLQEKVWVIRELEEPGVKIKQVAKKFGVSNSAVSRVRKHKDSILSRALSGDVCQHMRRSRDCKDPVLDKALLKWYRAIEALKDHPICIANILLQDKAKEIALAMGRSYFPSVNWILRWKHRHNIRCKTGRIESKEVLDEMDSNVEMTDIIVAIEGEMLPGETTVKTENGVQPGKPEKLIVCEHCGIMTNRQRDKQKNNHLKTCPVSTQSQRRDLTLGEKAQVVRCLDIPGIKMITLARKYGVSSSSISRIHKNRVDILARCAGAYVNKRRKRDRVSKEPEVERALCDWYRQQQEFGYHVSGSTVREKAHEIASGMGKDFWPSESWVFRWRHRNNIDAICGLEETEDGEEEQAVEVQIIEGQAELADAQTSEEGDKQPKAKRKRKKKKVVKKECESEEKVTVILPKSVMCEKCGCVSDRLKNNRICTMKHDKGCPDLKPRNELTYKERVRMLKALEEPGATLSSVARHFGISASSMSRMNQKKNSIMTLGIDHAGQKRIRDCKEPEVAKMLYDWFMEKQQEGIHVTGVKLKEKAATLARAMGREFKASTGWLGRWKHRYNIIFRQKEDDKSRTAVSKKKMCKRKAGTSFKQDEVMETLEEDHQEELNPAGVVSVMPDESQALQPQRMFLNQRYQNPWTVNHQPSSSCARPKDFIPTPNHGIPEESHVPYAYDPMSRHMFHNVFENFTSAAGYPVSMVEASVPVRDYLQPDGNEAHQPSSTHHHIIPHQPPPLNLHAAGIPQQHTTHPHQHSLHSSSHSPVVVTSVAASVHGGESSQQQQIMEACKLVNSFAKEKLLGEHVQAALRTVEMTLKGSDVKGHPRNSYTNM